MKTSTDFQEAGYTPANRNPPSGRLCDSAKNLKKRALARAITANDSENLSSLNFEAHVLQRPEFLDFVTLNDLPAMSEVDGFARKVLRFSRQHFTKRRTLLVFAMSNQIALREVFDGDDVIGHWPLKRWDSDGVRKAPFHFSELVNAHPQKKSRNDGARRQTRQVKAALPAKNAPADRLSGIGGPRSPRSGSSGLRMRHSASLRSPRLGEA